MPFILDEKTMIISGRRGDTASFNFDFNQDMSGYTVSFYVKQLNSQDIIIEKNYTNIVDSSVLVNLTTADTQKLVSQTNSYIPYSWGLKISKGIDFAQTVIPQENENPPMMYVYSEIGGV